MDKPEITTARAQDLVGCRTCGLASPMGQINCPRCGAGLQSRDGESLQKVWAWMLAGIIAYIPANLYPMMRTTQFFRSTDNTIVGGVIDLMHHGDLWVAGIVFFASVVIPIGKFIAIALLAILMHRRGTYNPHRLHLLYEVVEFIGRWSMVDVFVVAILAALVQFSVLATITPGIAAFCFCLSVVFTMLAAQSFDSRMIWDRMTPEQDDQR